MVEKKNNEQDTLLESNYDGIQEYDNDLPRWWLNIFWLTTFYAIFYAVYVHGGFRGTDEEILTTELTRNAAVKQAQEAQAAKNRPVVTEETLLELVSSSSHLKMGKEVYDKNCAACHMADGGGSIGPNLTDEYWIHGPTLMDHRNVVLKGVLEKGMVPWEGVLSDEEVNAVVVYIRSFLGTTPANPKDPQGEKAE